MSYFLILSILLILLVVFGIYTFFIPSSRLKRYGDKIPGPKAYPLVGNSFIFLQPSLSSPLLRKLQDLCESYGPIIRLWLGKQLFFILSDPKDIEVFLTSNKHLDKSESYRFLDSWLGNKNLLTSDADIWRIHRKLLTPSFHFKFLEDATDMVIKNTKILCNVLEEKVDQPEFNIEDYIEKFSLDVICETVMGVKMQTQISNDTLYLNCIKEVSDAIIERIYRGWLHPEFLFKLSGIGKKYFKHLVFIKRKVDEVITERRKLIEENGDASKITEDRGLKKKGKPFLDFLLTEGSFTDEEIENEVQAFMFAGHDTTKVAISFCLFELSQHQSEQEKIVEEIQALLASKETLTYQDFVSMKKLENVIKEAMRLYAPVPVISRKVAEDLLLPSGHLLPQGSLANLFIFHLHREEQYFPDAKKFKPERFELRNDKNSFTYIPFSAGHRHCIGQKLAMLEMKVAISYLLLNYKLLPSDNVQNLILETGIVLRSLNQIPLKIIRRK